MEHRAVSLQHLSSLFALCGIFYVSCVMPFIRNFSGSVLQCCCIFACFLKLTYTGISVLLPIADGVGGLSGLLSEMNLKRSSRVNTSTFQLPFTVGRWRLNHQPVLPSTLRRSAWSSMRAMEDAKRAELAYVRWLNDTAQRVQMSWPAEAYTDALYQSTEERGLLFDRGIIQ